VKKHTNYIRLIAFWAVSMLIIIGGSIFYKQYQGSEYDKLAIPYIQNVIPVISSWDPVATKALMVPEIAATIPDDKYARAMDFFSQLGALQSLEEPEFTKAHVDQETDIGQQTILEYKVDARYANGAAEIDLKLLERGGSFEIYRFNFSSEVLLPH